LRVESFLINNSKEARKEEAPFSRMERAEVGKNKPGTRRGGEGRILSGFWNSRGISVISQVK
jgi:hypothetical protein